MSISREKRETLKAAVLSALQKLRDKFPLERRIGSAPPDLQAAYSKVLGHWVGTGTSPTMEIVPELLLKELVAMDALVIDPHGVGCYPFSARDTGISVHYSSKSVHAMCAVDVLAVPRLVWQTSRVTARCALCRCPLACTVAANGSLAHGDNGNIRIIGWPRAVAAGSCCDNLCAGIKFICGHCKVPQGAMVLTLAQAAVLGNAFFGFQEQLLGLARGTEEPAV